MNDLQIFANPEFGQVRTVEIDGQPWLGILKLNYKNGYTHYTESVDGAPVNSIIQQRACLPTQSGPHRPRR